MSHFFVDLAHIQPYLKEFPYSFMWWRFSYVIGRTVDLTPQAKENDSQCEDPISKKTWT